MAARPWGIVGKTQEGAIVYLRNLSESNLSVREIALVVAVRVSIVK